MKIESIDTHIDLEASDTFNTYGGESNDEDLKGFDFYGIQFFGAYADFSIGNINPDQMVRLGTSIISHLMTNGHQFEIKDDRDGNGEYLTIKH